MQSMSSAQNRPLIVIGVAALLFVGYLYMSPRSGSAGAGAGGAYAVKKDAGALPPVSSPPAPHSKWTGPAVAGGHCSVDGRVETGCSEPRRRVTDYTLDGEHDARFTVWQIRNAIKQTLVTTLASAFDTAILVETGTYLGQMIEAQLKKFAEIHTVEVYEQLYVDARAKFAGQKHVNLHFGDSAVVLPKIIDALQGPALFWLDGHFSGGGTGRGKQDCPLRDELLALAASRFRDRNVILIDDMRMSGVVENGYPTVDELKRIVATSFPNSVPDYDDDVFRILPKLVYAAVPARGATPTLAEPVDVAPIRP